MSQGRLGKDLDHERLWSNMRSLVDRVASAADRATVLDQCLDQLNDLLGADRGLILLGTAGGTTHVVNARSAGRTLGGIEREEVSRALIREAQTSGEIQQLRPDSAAIGPDSAIQLGIAAAMAAPLTSRTPGILYLDFRDSEHSAGELHTTFVETAAELISMVIDQAEQLETAREETRAALATQQIESTAPDLEELLRPESMARVKRELETGLHSHLPILILGESGTGKTLLARAIAEATGRTPFVRATLGHSDDLNTITSELFGHEKGAYSGAFGSRTGLVAFADGGTLVLDEILNLPPIAQQLLLDFTQFGTYRPLGFGRAEPRRSRVRLIAATNGDLEAALRDDRFRDDLYHRLSSIKLELPPLRDRRADIPAMAEGYLRRREPNRGWTLALSARRMLLSEDLGWPGNVRQLETVVQRARERALMKNPSARTVEADCFEIRDLGVESPPAEPQPAETQDPAAQWRRIQAERKRLDEHERELIERTLKQCDGVVARAARELDMPRTGLVSRLSRLKIKTGDRN
jgi:transcriptional regulator with GAF, ATPase, and Fis domain